MLLLKDSGRPDNNEVDHRVRVGGKALVYGVPKTDILYNQEVRVIQQDDKGRFYCLVHGYTNPFVIEHSKLTALDDDDFMVIEFYDKDL